jgi:hypothetical protein
MKIILSLLFISSLSAGAIPPPSKLDLVPDEKKPAKAPPSQSTTGDIDMKQFQNVPRPTKRAARIDVNVSCQMPDGTTRKKGDRGYKECIENEENRVLKQPNLPEAEPYDPRAN